MYSHKHSITIRAITVSAVIEAGHLNTLHICITHGLYYNHFHLFMVCKL